MLHVQDEAVEHVASAMERLMSEEVNLRRLYIIQTYGIGKERVFIEVGHVMPFDKPCQTPSPYPRGYAKGKHIQPVAQICPEDCT